MGDFTAPIWACRNTEHFGDGSPALKMHTNRPKVWFAASLPGMPLAKLKEIFFRGVNKWAIVANVLAIEAKSQGESDWIIVPSRIDGKNGVLADMMLPGPRPQYMRLDVAENASEAQLEQTCLHEAGHGYGLFHTPAGPPPEVMDPSLNMSVRTPQAAEAKLMESMYGAPVITPPVPSPGTMEVRGEVKVIINGVPYGAAGPFKQLPQSFVYPPTTVREEWDEEDTEILPE